MLRELITNDWYTVFLLLALICVSVSKILFSRRFEDFIYVIANSNYLKIYVRDQKFIDAFDGLLFAASVISITVFGYTAQNTLAAATSFDVGVFLKLLFAVTSFLLIKTLLERLIGSLFEIDSLMDAYLFQKTTYKNFIGLFLIPVNLFFIYSIQPTKVAIYAVIAVVFAINLIGFITSFRNFQKLLISNFFYFILYLCALEIGPYIILYHLITKYNI